MYYVFSQEEGANISSEASTPVPLPLLPVEFQRWAQGNGTYWTLLHHSRQFHSNHILVLRYWVSQPPTGRNFLCTPPRYRIGHRRGFTSGSGASHAYDGEVSPLFEFLSQERAVVEEGGSEVLQILSPFRRQTRSSRHQQAHLHRHHERLHCIQCH